MWNRQYQITMKTPVGARYGTMTVVADSGRVSGMLNILKKSNPFHGIIQENGDCEIEGKITTLMRTIPFDAAGKMTEESLNLTLEGERESFEISGRADGFPSGGKEGEAR